MRENEFHLQQSPVKAQVQNGQKWIIGSQKAITHELG